MLNIVSSYATRWKYQLNPEKSAVMVFGESSRSRSTGRLNRKWYLSNSLIHETDHQHHLGILCSVLNSTIHWTNEMLSSPKCLLRTERCWFSIWMSPPHHNPQNLFHPLSSHSPLQCRAMGPPQSWTSDNGACSPENPPHRSGPPYSMSQCCNLQPDSQEKNF